ncbi:hypothetical protein AAE02nite_47750 [Adhaeribacter aerolatus]|uniref:Uncharacterized protein n=1 Tax=Adhaeribacter aerolatus TaxID=670289 RepID=A0A512B5A0_9BACT|nr:T9SS type A sorting domain-containing protein [Adhaeribacter aerolatus]GEO07111.1 hypothetical protein AAE02nite_47750 [Adhaeribacter aerolatus]
MNAEILLLLLGYLNHVIKPFSVGGLLCLIFYFSTLPNVFAQGQLAGGEFNSFAISKYGKLYAWGFNWSGQLGNGTNVTSTVPIDISNFGALAGKTIIQVVSEARYTLALATDGTVYAWGSNFSRNLGSNQVGDSNVPVQVNNLSGIISISGGERHSLALKSDGTVYAWGSNNNGQLGNGSLDPFPISTPMQVVNLSEVIAIAGGDSHSLALKSDGTVYAWGRGYSGQLGDGNFYTDSPYGSAVPVEVTALHNVTAIAAGPNYSLALKGDGTVFGWGNNYSSSVPVQVDGLSGITAIAAAYFHSLALKSDSTVYAWGSGQYGQLGNGVFYNTYPFGSTEPVRVSGLTGITAIAGGRDHSLALKADGSVYAWGSYNFGNLGNDSGVPSAVPVQVIRLNLLNQGSGEKESPVIEWDKTIGGNYLDYLTAILPTPDGGYILGGYSSSGTSGDKSENVIGGFIFDPNQSFLTFNHDYWLVKLDASGTKEWDNTIGGNGNDHLAALQLTADGGYILGGFSNSNASGDKSENNNGFTDFWVVKVNATGAKEWDKTINDEATNGFSMNDLIAIQQTPDGGFILGGEFFSNAGGNAIGSLDYRVIKLDATGNKEWDKTFGGTDHDLLTTIHQITDGGYILGGTSYSDAGGDKSENAKGRGDYWIVKLHATGTKEWDKTIGGHGGDELTTLQQTADGGYILGGNSISDASGDKSERQRGYDYWVVKLNAAGSKEWDKTLSGDWNEDLTALQQTADGGYLLGGNSESSAGRDKIENSKGGPDYWVVKLNATGSREWDKTIGGSLGEALRSLQQTADGGYILGGYSNSNVSGNKSENSKGYFDYWVVKLGPTSCSLALTTQVTQAEPWYGMWGYSAGAGRIDLSVSGGTAPYTYIWNAGVSSQDIPIATPGQYSVTVTDATGCTAITQIFVGRNNDFLRVLSTHKNVSTPGDNDGAIDLTVVGGVVPATYRWSNGTTTEDLTNLSAGTYMVVVTDAFGRKASTTVIISEPGTPLSLAISHQNVSAAGKQDGAVDLTVIGGSGPYTYQWNTGARTEDLHYAAPGLYTVLVTDATGATATASIRIEVGHSLIMMARQPNGANDILALPAALTVYPNPATEKAIVNFSLTTAGKYTLDLYDIHGAKVKTLASGKTPANKALEVKVNVGEFTKGVYLLKLQTEQGIYSQRLLIQR